MTPFFSVIIPLYNKEDFIVHTVKSVLNQSFKDFEIIVINDGSTDSSLKRVEALKDKAIQILTIENKGVSHARNYGISKAKADYIAFLDADDYWHVDFLKYMTYLIDTYKNESVFASALKITTQKKDYKASYKGLPELNKDIIVDYFEASQDHSILHCSSSVFKKTVFDNVGGFNEQLKTSEDTDLWIRIGLHYRVVFTNHLLATHQVVGNGLTLSNRTQFNSTDFSKYDDLAKTHLFARKFINNNRYASALKHKLADDYKNYELLLNEIDKNLLSLKQQILLALPKGLLLFVFNLYNQFSSKKNYF